MVIVRLALEPVLILIDYWLLGGIESLKRMGMKCLLLLFELGHGLCSYLSHTSG